MPCSSPPLSRHHIHCHAYVLPRSYAIHELAFLYSDMLRYDMSPPSLLPPRRHYHAMPLLAAHDMLMRYADAAAIAAADMRRAIITLPYCRATPMLMILFDIAAMIFDYCRHYFDFLTLP